MRLAVSLLSCVAASVVSIALADPAPNEPSASTTTTPASPKPATPKPAAPAAAATPASAAAPAAAHPAAASATPTTTVSPGVDVEAAHMDQLEKHFLAEGYKIEMHGGEKYFCRREEQLGSRLGGAKHCTTAQQLDYTENDSQRQAADAVRQQASGPR